MNRASPVLQTSFCYATWFCFSLLAPENGSECHANNALQSGTKWEKDKLKMLRACMHLGQVRSETTYRNGWCGVCTVDSGLLTVGRKSKTKSQADDKSKR